MAHNKSHQVLPCWACRWAVPKPSMQFVKSCQHLCVWLGASTSQLGLQLEACFPFPSSSRFARETVTVGFIIGNRIQMSSVPLGVWDFVPPQANAACGVDLAPPRKQSVSPPCKASSLCHRTAPLWSSRCTLANPERWAKLPKNPAHPIFQHLIPRPTGHKGSRKSKRVVLKTFHRCLNFIYNGIPVPAKTGVGMRRWTRLDSINWKLGRIY